MKKHILAGYACQHHGINICVFKWNSTRIFSILQSTKMTAVVWILIMCCLFRTICNALNCNQTMYPLDDMCVTAMVQGSYPACGNMDLTFARRICELRDTSDTRTLRAVATLAGQVSGPWPWASFQIRKSRIAHAPGMPVSFSRSRGLAIPTCIMAHAWRKCRDACRDRHRAVCFEVGGEENVPGIPGACATRNFTYLVRDPLRSCRTGSFWTNTQYPLYREDFIVNWHCFTWMYMRINSLCFLLVQLVYVSKGSRGICWSCTHHME